MVEKFLQEQLKSKLGHIPTKGQSNAINCFLKFLEDREEFCVFILTGYAGTGKTSLISALIQVFDEIKINNILLAPTGRAAKVLSNYSHHQASTIHKCIYRKKSTKRVSGDFSINFNHHKDTIFIVDEASMIGNNETGNNIFGSGRLLDDLLSFVFNGNNCRLILLGDPVQLPPIGTILSPALDKDYIVSLNMKVFSSELYDVVRQTADSGILYNATLIRENIISGRLDFPKIKLNGFNDIISINGSELLEEIENCYSKLGIHETKIVCKTNKQANKYNLGIRNRILWFEEEITNGDLLMIVKNNYSWLPEKAEIDFIANGDIVEVIKVGKKIDIYGYRYVDLLIKFIDFPDLEIEVKAILDSLTIDSAGMDTSYYKDLYEQLSVDYEHITDSKKRHEAILSDPYFNALQVKFAYALTCHKSQGGQWDAVFVDHGWLNPDSMSAEQKIDFFRWLYTAFTRATEKLYLINFSEKLTDPI